jgi:RNA polymerase sigma factor (sigma-70 family)
MAHDAPVSLWIEELRGSDEVAARNLWNYFVVRLAQSARRQLRSDTRRVYDEDDAAQSAFISFCAGIAEGRFPELRDRESLWRLLITITARKVSHRHRYDRQQCRDIRRTTSGSYVQPAVQSDLSRSEQLLAQTPQPEFAAEFADVCHDLMLSLGDAKLQEVAILRMEGYNDSEIAKRQACSRSTVQRRLEAIRRRWQQLYGEENDDELT